jgi:hypothetical protein
VLALVVAVVLLLMLLLLGAVSWLSAFWKVLPISITSNT